MFLGPPGAGKGTQAAALAAQRGVLHLSTGDLLRAAIAAGTPLGREVDQYMRAGELVPDDLMLRALSDRLTRPDARAGFVLDGFPRTIAQASALEQIAPLDLVVSFELSQETLVERLSGRRVCPRCQTVYNVTTRPPRLAGRCDLDGAELVQRPDDQPGPIANRMKVYARQTAPLLQYYQERGRLRTLAANGSPEEVAARLRRIVDAVRPETTAPTRPASR